LHSHKEQNNNRYDAKEFHSDDFFHRRHTKNKPPVRIEDKEYFSAIDMHRRNTDISEGRRVSEAMPTYLCFICVHLWLNNLALYQGHKDGREAKICDSWFGP
jgi:hypothetical protein